MPSPKCLILVHAEVTRTAYTNTNNLTGKVTSYVELPGLLQQQ